MASKERGGPGNGSKGPENSALVVLCEGKSMREGSMTLKVLNGGNDVTLTWIMGV